MDGVLIDSEPVWQATLDAVFGRMGIVLDEAMKARTAGMGNAESVALVLANAGVQADVAAVCREIDEQVLRRFAAGVGAIPGSGELVRELAAARVPLAMVSTSAPPLMHAMLRALQLESFFRVVLSSEEVGPGKPDPAVYREAVCRLEADAAASIAVEDTINGAASAHGAGLRVIGLTQDSAVARGMRPHAWQVARDYVAVRRLVLSCLQVG